MKVPSYSTVQPTKTQWSYLLGNTRLVSPVWIEKVGVPGRRLWVTAKLLFRNSVTNRRHALDIFVAGIEIMMFSPT